MAFTPRYEPESPYAFTTIIGRFMTYYVHRTVPPHPLDTVVRIVDQKYVNRPDLLAFDLYGDPDLFWVLAVRNGLQDPVFDFKLGELYVIPHPSHVRDVV